ncbi:hypothetical protein D3C85_1795280 [compost metagenome]
MVGNGSGSLNIINANDVILETYKISSQSGVSEINLSNLASTSEVRFELNIQNADKDSLVVIGDPYVK